MSKSNPKKILKKRLCKVCGCKLSIYNEGDQCHCHNDGDKLIAEDRLREPSLDSPKNTTHID